MPSAGSTWTSSTRLATHYSGLDITTPGCQLLAGTQALAVARSRHYQYYATTEWQTDPTGDFGRIKRQDAFLRALVDAAKSKYNPLTINAFLGSLPQGIVIDTHLSLGDLLGLAEDFHSINPTAIKTLTLPTFSTGYVTPWGDVLFVQQPEAQQLLVSVFGSELTTPTSPPPNTALVPSPPPDLTSAERRRARDTDARVDSRGFCDRRRHELDRRPVDHHDDRAPGPLVRPGALQAGLSGRRHRRRASARVVPGRPGSAGRRLLEALGEGVPAEGGALDADRELHHALEGGQLAQLLEVDRFGGLVVARRRPPPSEASWIDIIDLNVRISRWTSSSGLALHRRRT